MPVVAPGSLVLLIGGKTTFCQQLIVDGRLPPNAAISPDLLRAQVFDSIEEGREKGRIERLTLELVELRLQYGKTVVPDDHNLLPERRKAFHLLAERWKRPTTAVVFDTLLDELLHRGLHGGLGLPGPVIHRPLRPPVRRRARPDRHRRQAGGDRR